MGLLFLDSFDHYVTADLTEKWTANGSMLISAAAGRNGTAGLRGGASAANCSRALATTANTLVVGVAFKLAGLTTHIVEIGEAGATHVGVWAAADGSLNIDRTAAATWLNGVGTILASSTTGRVAVGTSYHLQFKVVVGDAPSGSVEIRLNGTMVASATGVDTRNAGTGIANLVYLGGNCDFDDLYVLDNTGAALNDFLGDCRVDARYPTAEGASSAWTPLSGTDNALMVDEAAPDDDTTYNSTPTIGATDTLVVQDAPVPGAVFLGVQLSLSQKKTDAGTCSIAPVVRHAGVDTPLTAGNPGTTYAYQVVPLGTNPGTGAAWTEAEFNAAEFGYRRTA